MRKRRKCDENMKKIDIAKLKRALTSRSLLDIKNKVICCSQVAVNQNGIKIYEAEFGTNGADGEKLRKDATFRIASMTKPITVLAVLQQVEKGNIDLNAPVSEYLEGYKNLPIGKKVNGKLEIVGKSKTPIRLYNLFSHTSGVEAGDIVDEFTTKMTEEEKSSLKTVVEYFSDKPLFFETGTAQSYSPHVAFDIGARIVEKVSGMDFASYIKHNITDLIGMKDTTFTPTDEQWDRLVKLHELDVNGNMKLTETDRKHIYALNPITYYCGGAGLMSTTADYLLFAETLLRGGVAPNGKKVIDEKYLKEMSKPYCPIEFMGEGACVTWGLGVRVFTNGNGRLPQGTFGWSGAYGTHFWVDPINKIVAVYMKNSLYDGGSGAVTSAHFEEDVINSI